MFNSAPQPLSFILSAPAGTGKTSLVNAILQRHPNVTKHVSYTTRSPRPGERDGHDYAFCSRDTFFAQQADFLESIEIAGHHYATSREQLAQQKERSCHTIFVIDPAGALRLMRATPCVSIFLLPPSYEALKQRLEKRNTETAIEIQKRLDRVEKELEMLVHYDYYIVNDVLEDACQVFSAILRAEEHKTKYLGWKSDGKEKSYE